MSNLLKRKVKSFITGAVMSFGKVQESLSQNVNGVENTISIEQEVQKQEIKLIKKERFYNLIEKSDKYEKTIRHMNPEDKKRFIELSQIKTDDVETKTIITQEMSQLLNKTINENQHLIQEPTSFKNKRLGKIMEDINDLDPNAKHKFETNNDLYKISHYVKLNKTDVENVIQLDFYINKVENPSILYTDVTDLNYFKVIENGKTYSYTNIMYEGRISKPNEYDVVHRFISTIEKNGEYDFDMNREDVILDKYNTMSKTNVNFNLEG